MPGDLDACARAQPAASSGAAEAAARTWPCWAAGDAVSALLKDPVYGRFPADHVKLIEDEQATTVNVRAGLNWLARQASEDDLAVIYIASHGTSRDQDEAGASYVVAFDTDVQSRDGLYSTAIPLVEISNVVRTRVKALKAVVILDTCHSQGAVTQTVTVPASMPPQMLDHIREGTGRVIIGASQAEESSFESAKYGHGLFTYYLLQGLRERKDAPVEKIYQYVRAHVTQDAAANGWKQHPFLSASDGQSSVVLSIAATPLAWLFDCGPIIKRPGLRTAWLYKPAGCGWLSVGAFRARRFAHVSKEPPDSSATGGLNRPVTQGTLQ
jgi:hypothetical protein